MSLRQNTAKGNPITNAFSYQSECHCAKTPRRALKPILRLVTSQNVTAPKLYTDDFLQLSSLVTSQNVTAPKLYTDNFLQLSSLVTSQNVTAPKLVGRYVRV